MQGLEALENEERVERREAGSDVAQQRDAGPHDERRAAHQRVVVQTERLVEDEAVIAGVRFGELGEFPFAQLNLPESTMAPPMLVPWPPMNFVIEYTMMSAPWSNGRKISGLTVLSTTNGMPCA